MSMLQLLSIARFFRALLGRLATASLQLGLPFFSTVFPYRHQEPVDDKTIRLIRLPDNIDLLDFSHSSHLSLTIDSYSLAACPPYLALSYTWGPSDRDSPPYQRHDRQPIQVNGRRFLVYPNLRGALRQLAISRPGQHVWIDGICINQNDPVERSVQVAIMDRIYSGADETIIWLGASNERSEKGLQKLRDMSKDATTKIMEWGASQTAGTVFIADDTEQLARSGLPATTADEWLDLSDVFSRAWFQRVWVIQEVALSKNPTVLVGGLSVAWSTLGNAASLIVSSNAALGLFGVVGSAKHLLALIEGVSLAAMLHMLCEWCQGDQSVYHTVFQSMDFAVGIGTSSQADLLSLLMASKGFRASLPQDKIYGFLGILNHMAKAKSLPVSTIKVDYVSPPDEVLRSLGCYLYEETQSLHLLSHAGEAARWAPSPNPTWIPTFENANYPVLSPHFSKIKQYNASRSFPPTFQIVRQPALRLQVQVASPTLGSVEELGETWQEFNKGNFINSISMLLHCGDGNIYAPTSQSVVEAFWRTLIMDTDTSSRPASNPELLSSSFKSWFQLIAMTALMKARQHSAEIFEVFDSLEPLFTLANSRDTTNLLPKSADMIKLLFSLGFFHDPNVPLMTETESNALTMRLGAEAASYEAVLRPAFVIARRLVRTVRGYLCLVPSGAQIGDKIMIVKGCPAPLVLRKVPEEPDCLRVIGDVYVHGAMFGEHILDDVQWRDVSLA